MTFVPLAGEAGAPAGRQRVHAAAEVRTASLSVRPPAFTDLAGTGLVLSASPNLSFAPDGSRVAWSADTLVYTAHPDGNRPVVAANDAKPLGRLAYSPTGSYIAIDDPQRITVTTAAAARGLDTWDLPAGSSAVSWVSSDTVVAVRHRRPASLELVPVFGGAIRRYTPPAGWTVADAMASPNGTRIAVRETGGTAGAPSERLVVVDTATLRRAVTVVGPGRSALGRPAWSPDSATVYAPSTSGDVTSIVSHAATTAAGEPAVVVADAGTTPYVYLRPRGVGRALGQRVTGRDVVASAVTVSRQAFGATRARSCRVVGGATSAVLAKAGSVETAVAGPLAARSCGPVLLTGARSLDSRTAAELRRLLARGRTVYLVGNTGSLSPAVATAVARLGFRVVRYGGADVYGTAVQVALKGWRDHRTAAFASGTQPLAAAAAAATAGATGVPLLLTGGRRVPAVVGAYVKKYDVRAWVVGTEGAAAVPWAYRYAGKDDVTTSLVVAFRFFYPPRDVTLVGTASVADAYLAGAEAALYAHPLLVVPSRALIPGQRTYLDQVSASLDAVRLFGSTRQVSGGVLSDAVALAGNRIR